MGRLVLPNFILHSALENQMGQVIVTITLTNWVDQVMAQRGFIPPEEVRTCTLDNVLVDTGATLLCLPTSIANQLGLVEGGQTNVETSAGVAQGSIFRGVELSVEGRKGTFDCLAMPDVPYALLGVVPLEALGLEPDLKNHKLRVLPMNTDQTYLSAL